MMKLCMSLYLGKYMDIIITIFFIQVAMKILAHINWTYETAKILDL